MQMALKSSGASISWLRLQVAMLCWSVLPAVAADAVLPSAGASAAKMLLGLLTVLLLMAGVAWLVRRFIPHGGHSASVAKLVGGLSLGSRERIVVLEVAGQWLVVGIASGQMTSLATLTPPNPSDLEAYPPQPGVDAKQSTTPASTQAFAQTLAKWMKPHV